MGSVVLLDLLTPLPSTAFRFLMLVSYPFLYCPPTPQARLSCVTVFPYHLPCSSESSPEAVFQIPEPGFTHLISYLDPKVRTSSPHLRSAPLPLFRCVPVSPPSLKAFFLVPALLKSILPSIRS